METDASLKKSTQTMVLIRSRMLTRIVTVSVSNVELRSSFTLSVSF